MILVKVGVLKKKKTLRKDQDEVCHLSTMPPMHGALVCPNTEPGRLKKEGRIPSAIRLCDLLCPSQQLETSKLQ